MIFDYPYIVYLPFNIKIIVIYVSFIGLFLGYLVRNIGIYSSNKFIITYNFRSFLSLM